MKKLLLLSLLVTTLSASGQQPKPWMEAVSGTFTGIVVAANNDTLEIPALIKFIKVDGKVFEIKRKVELQFVEPPTSWDAQWLERYAEGKAIILDTTYSTIDYYTPKKLKNKK
jgi:hypothetical protein